MPKLHIFLRYWLIVLVWMVVIFSASSDSGSFQRSSRILAPLIRWLLPRVSEEGVHAVVVFVRKCGHVIEYAAFALLLWRALRKPRRGDDRPWNWHSAALALALVMAYAASDELHQAFVPTREASIVDVLIDTFGGALGLLLLWGYTRVRCKVPHEGFK